MKVLVTGATGFIGNYVITELLKRGLTVIATSSSEIKAREKDWFNKVVFIPYQIQAVTSENLYKKFNEPDALIHLAWGNLHNFKDNSHISEVFPNHLHFLENLLSNGLNDLTVTGTCLEYGMKEGELHENMDSAPTIAYPIAKNMLYKKLTELNAKGNFSLKWVRLFYMFGKGQSPKSILSQLESALDRGDEVFNMSPGDQQRDYLPVSSVAENIVIFALQKKMEGLINCCSNQPISIKLLVENYLKDNHKTIKLNLGHYPYPDYEPFKFWGNNSKEIKIKNL